MNRDGGQDLSQLSMLDLFRIEVETQSAELTRGLLSLENNLQAKTELPSLMRAAHSLKGAARILNRDFEVRIAHAMEDCLTALQSDARTATPSRVDGLLAGVDLLRRTAQLSDADLGVWTEQQQPQVERLLQALTADDSTPLPAMPPVAERAAPAEEVTVEKIDVRVSSGNLSRLLFMAGEALVASRRLEESSRNVHRLKRAQLEMGRSVFRLRQRLAAEHASPAALTDLLEVEQRAAGCGEQMVAHRDQLEAVNRHVFNLSHRLHEEVLDCRMRPLSEAIAGLPRMVRDIGRELGKSVRLEVVGGATAVDRDVLERLKVPLTHLVRNAIDHGTEPPEVRRDRGKPAMGTVRLEARHSGGMLLVSISDDGNGIDRPALQALIVGKRLDTPETLAKMSDAEVFQFLFLPGFTMKNTVTDISGRGVGLDIVQTTIKEIGGTVRLTSEFGKGTRFELELPLTLSLIRALLVDIDGAPYAFPLARLTAVVRFARSEIVSLEGRQHFRFRDSHVLLLSAREVMDFEGEEKTPGDDLAVVVLNDGAAAFYGLAVDRFLGERELVVLGLDPSLGKVRGISAGALMPDDSPLLILDVDDLLRSVEGLAARSRLKGVAPTAAAAGLSAVPGVAAPRRKRILAVDDSLTVRELERKLLRSRGYDVDTAVDGMDAWNTVRNTRYDLVVTDVDMPRMDGVELLKLIKKDPKLQSVPVLIVSYKDREEDRRRGLDAGADYYLTKGSFQNEILLQAVADLIGEAVA